MKWTCEEILDHAEELADRFEAFDPAEAQEVPGPEYLLVRAARGQDCCDEHVVQALRAAREQGTSWKSASVQSSASRASRHSASETANRSTVGSECPADSWAWGRSVTYNSGAGADLNAWGRPSLVLWRRAYTSVPSGHSGDAVADAEGCGTRIDHDPRLGRTRRGGPAVPPGVGRRLRPPSVRASTRRRGRSPSGNSAIKSISWSPPADRRWPNRQPSPSASAVALIWHTTALSKSSPRRARRPLSTDAVS